MDYDLEIKALQSQLARAQELQLAAADGMRANLEGKPQDSCPYEGAQRDAWLMGYLQQQREQTNEALIVALRQGIRSQAEYTQHHLDVTQEKLDDPVTWWSQFLTDESSAAFEGTPEHIKLYERVFSSAINVVTHDAIKDGESGIEVDNNHGDLLLELIKNVNLYLDMKGSESTG